MDSFNLHYPLFLEAFEKNEVGVCRWNEAGTTIDTAVPELVELTCDKAEWRAVIVHVESEQSMDEYPSSARNPFDFLVNAGGEDKVEESPVPLVRLAQMLGGVPAPVTRFREKIIRDEMPPRVTYEPIEDAQQQDIYERLTKKYQYDGKKPTEIILVTLKAHNDDSAGSGKKAWRNAVENASSGFWQRNHYPSSCRFLAFETTLQGRVERAAERFRFWTAVLLLSVKQLEPGTLQAYRLHTVDAVLDTAALSATFQRKVNRLAGARATIRENIRVEHKKRLNEISVLPDYAVDVPVTFDYSTQPIKRARMKRFALSAKNVQRELHEWESLQEASEGEVAAAFHATDRTLEQSAERLHGTPEYSGQEIRRLDKYEVQDFELKLENTYGGIMEVLEKLPREAAYNQEALAESAQKVSAGIRGRITRVQALVGAAVAAALFGLSVMPAGIYLKTQGVGSPTVLAGALLIGVAAVALAALVTLMAKRLALHKAVDAHSRKLMGALAELSLSGRDFSRYLSQVASHIRGASYLKQFYLKRDGGEKLMDGRKKHLQASEAFTQRLKAWSVAFHLPVNFGEDAIEDNVVIDPLSPPGKSVLYAFEHTVPLNANRAGVDFPLAFVRQLKITREELYDDQ